MGEAIEGRLDRRDSRARQDLLRRHRTFHGRRFEQRWTRRHPARFGKLEIVLRLDTAWFDTDAKKSAVKAGKLLTKEVADAAVQAATIAAKTEAFMRVQSLVICFPQLPRSETAGDAISAS